MQPAPERVTSGCWLLWYRADLPRERAAAYWSGPHGRIVSAVPHKREYRQLHLSADDHGFWPAPDGLGVRIPADWRIDGMPEVVLETPLKALRAALHQGPVWLDEQHAFDRMLCRLSGPGGARWWTGPHDDAVGARAVIFVRRRRGRRPGAFARFLHQRLGRALLDAGALEVRTHAFSPTPRLLHPSPGVDHSDPAHRRYSGAIVVGTTDREALERLLAAPALEATHADQRGHCLALHAYAVERCLAKVVEGRPV